MGHEPVGSCSGNIVEFNRCETVYLHDMGLFGCGVVGLRAEDCTDVFVEHSEIYECAQSAAEFVRSEQISFVGCKIFGIGTSEEPAKAAVLLTDAESVQFVGCEFYDNTAETLVSGTADRVSVSGSAIQNNKLISACFAVMSEDFHLDTNWFTENDMPHWFAPGTAETENHSGNPETEVDAESASQDELPAQEEIRVSNVDELLDAIGPNRKIILTSETYDLSTATGYGEARGTYWYWIERHDGPELSIFGVDNMTICGESGEITAHTIEAVPRYADVLFFDTCTNITLSGFTAGHTVEPGNCSGGVLTFRDSQNITVERCGLYGCGILGVETMYCENVTVCGCDIYECSMGGIKMWSTYYVTLENNSFRDIGREDTEDEMVFSSCGVVVLNGEEVLDFGSLSLGG